MYVILILCRQLTNHRGEIKNEYKEEIEGVISYQAVCEKDKNNYETSWGPEFDKDNHPLAIMV